MKNPLSYPRATAAAAVCAAALLGAGGGAAVVAAVGTGEAGGVRTVTVADGDAAAASATSVGEIYEEASRSVVKITVTTSGTTPLGEGGGGESQGSGFVYDDERHVITNQHVVGDADTATVTLADGTTRDATVVGSDPSTDLAVLEVDAPAADLVPLELADSGELKVGDGVIAIGSPFGLDGTVTTGIVSALHRQITAPNDYAINDAIQTDAAINHGNSGGPLLNANGDVVGVNSQIESESGGNDGIGFAVPSNTVEKIAGELIADGSVEHAYLGVGVEDATGDEAGARLTSVRAGTPAREADLEVGDVVTAVDGEDVGDAQELQRLIDSRSPGDTVELTVTRDGRRLDVDVTLTTRPSA